MIPFACGVADGVSIAGAVFPAEGAARGTVVLAHGLPAGRPAPAADGVPDEGYPGLARRIVPLGLHVAIFNFRGTGQSGGHLDIDCWPDDLRAVLDWLDGSAFSQARYAVVGFSAGGAASILASAVDDRLDPLVTMAAPADYSFLPIGTDPTQWFAFYRELDMIRDGYPGDAASWAARFARVRPREAIGRSRASAVFLVHGTADDVVPVGHADILWEAGGGRAERIILRDTIHQMRRDEAGVTTLLDILARALPGTGAKGGEDK